MAYTPPTIGPAGLSINLPSDIKADLIAAFLGIYGQNTYLGTDSADYQDMAINALKHSDTEAALQQVYLNRSPLTAIGAALDSLGKLMGGATRNGAGYSTAQLTIAGKPNTVINNGIAQDVNGNLWMLPASVVIPQAGSIVITATAQTIGNINAEVGQIATMATPIAGWTSVINAAAAAPGAAVEQDSVFRARMLISSAGPSMSPTAALNAKVAAVNGVTRSRVYENYYGFTANFGAVNTAGTSVSLVSGYPFDATDVSEGISINGIEYTIAAVAGPDSLTINTSAGTQTAARFFVGDGYAIGPKNSVTAVVENGADADIAQAIYSRRGIGPLANGSTSVVVTDPQNGNTAMTVSFDRLQYSVTYAALSVHGFSGFTSATQAAIRNAVANYLNSLGIGESIIVSEIYGAALLARPDSDSPLFSIKSVMLGTQVSTTTGDLTSGNNTVAVASATGIASGQIVVGAGIAANTTVSAISGTTVTLSENSISTASGVTLSFFATTDADISVSFNVAAQSSAAFVVVNTV